MKRYQARVRKAVSITDRGFYDCRVTYGDIHATACVMGPMVRYILRHLTAQLQWRIQNAYENLPERSKW